MKKVLFGLVAIMSLLLVSCGGGYKDVEFHGIENVKVESADKQKVVLTMDAKIYNPNTFNIKIKPSDLDMMVGTNKLGVARITHTTKLKKLEKGNYPIRIEGTWKDLFGSGFGGILGALTKKKVDLTLKGDLRVGAFGLSKTLPVDYTKSVDLSAMKGVM